MGTIEEEMIGVFEIGKTDLRLYLLEVIQKRSKTSKLG
jgi:hypothetical protein